MTPELTLWDLIRETDVLSSVYKYIRVKGRLVLTYIYMFPYMNVCAQGHELRKSAMPPILISNEPRPIPNPRNYIAPFLQPCHPRIHLLPIELSRSPQSSGIDHQDILFVEGGFFPLSRSADRQSWARGSTLTGWENTTSKQKNIHKKSHAFLGQTNNCRSWNSRLAMRAECFFFPFFFHENICLSTFIKLERINEKMEIQISNNYELIGCAKKNWSFIPS